MSKVDEKVMQGVERFLGFESDPEYAASVMDETYHIVTMAFVSDPDNVRSGPLPVSDILHHLRLLRDAFSGRIKN